MTRNYTIVVEMKDGSHIVESSGFCHTFTDVRLTMNESIKTNDEFKSISRVVVVGPNGNTVLFYIDSRGQFEAAPTGNRQVQQWYSEERDAS